MLGRAHDVIDEHSPQAEAALTKAVKLDPQLVEAWNQLGESYWKRDNIKEAKNCFQGALKKVLFLVCYITLFQQKLLYFGLKLDFGYFK